MGGYDIYCYVCGVPVYDLKKVLDKKDHCKIPPELLEELRLGYFHTSDGVIHKVKDFDTGGYVRYIDTDTNTIKDAGDLVAKAGYVIHNTMCHRNCSAYLKSIKDPTIQKLINKHDIQGQFFDAEKYVTKVLPVQILDQNLLKNTCNTSVAKKASPKQSQEKQY